MDAIQVNKDLPPLEWYTWQKYDCREERKVLMAVVFNLSASIQVYYEIDNDPISRLYSLAILVIGAHGKYTKNTIRVSRNIDTIKEYADKYRWDIVLSLFTSYKPLL